MQGSRDSSQAQATAESQKAAGPQERPGRHWFAQLLSSPDVRLYLVVGVSFFVLILTAALYTTHTVTFNSSIIFGILSGVSFLWFLTSATLGRDELLRQEQPGHTTIFTISTMAVLEFFTLGLILAYFVTLLVSPSQYLGGNSTSPLAIAPAAVGNSSEWVLNLGGVGKAGGFQGGVQIPLYVIVLGAIGAFVNFLTKMPELLNLENEVDNFRKRPRDPLSWEEAYVRARLLKQQNAIRLMADYFLAPLIVIGVYFLLVQAGTSSSFSIGIVALGSGLSAPLIVARITDTVKAVGKPSPAPSP